MKTAGDRRRLGTVSSEDMVTRLATVAGVERIAHAGSLAADGDDRRHRLLAVAEDPASSPRRSRPCPRSPKSCFAATKTSVRTTNGFRSISSSYRRKREAPP